MQETSIWAFIKGILYAVFCFLEIDKGLFNILFVFMILDTISGLLKVLKLEENGLMLKIDTIKL